jgi:DNA-binding transcriptional LysR family regulator
MLRKIDWEGRIGRRLRLRDLHVLSVVAQHGSMARAAMQLGVSAPTVSEVIADLEHGLGVQLLDRSPQGVEPTIYGQAILKRGLAAFDELKQGIRDIEFLTDPTGGELRIGCGVTVSAAILPPIIHAFAQRFPRVALHVNEVPPPTRDLSGLRERKFDLVLGRWIRPSPQGALDDDLNVEVLFDDPLVVASGTQHRLSRRRKIDLTDLIDEPWILTPPNTWNHMGLEEAFRARSLALPRISLVTSSVHVCMHLLAKGEYVTALANSLADRYELKALRVELPAQPWPVAIITLKHRTLSPVVGLFIKHLREFAEAQRKGRPASR